MILVKRDCIRYQRLKARATGEHLNDIIVAGAQILLCVVRNILQTSGES